MTVDAILMASGFSTRFGTDDKLLAPFKGQPLATHTLRLACGMPEFGRVLFVCASPAVAALAKPFPRAEVIHNPSPGLGQRNSIRLGVAASTADHYLFFTCDQPLLDEATIRAILAKAAPGAIVVPTAGGKQASPALFSAVYRDELTNLPKGAHARDIKQRHADKLVLVPVHNTLALTDIDTPEELKKLEYLP